MNNNNRNIILGGVLVTVAVLVFIFLVPNFEREEFDKDKVEDISQGITTTSEVQQDSNNDEINDNNSQNQIEELIKKKIDLIILSDYGHGFFSKRIREEINRVNNFTAINAQVNSSSIGYHTISKYKKANLVLMNEKELRHELRDKNSNQLDLIKKLQKKIAKICKKIRIFAKKC